MTDADRCTCELVDISTYTEKKYIRGLSRGCPVHPPTEREAQLLAEEERYRAIDEAAKRAAREAS
jgi:hypothetical protein